MPKITITKVKRAIPVESGNSLASIIKQLTDMGVTDFSKVHFESNYVSCAADHGDGYCYCNPSYDELRFEFMQDTSNTEK